MKTIEIVKFSFFVKNDEVKNFVNKSFDFDVSLTYPQLQNAPEYVKIKGTCSREKFEDYFTQMSNSIGNFEERILFISKLKTNFRKTEPVEALEVIGSVSNVTKKNKTTK